VSWSELFTTGPGTPPATGLRQAVLGALAEAFITRRAAMGFCGDCRPGRLCPDHAEDQAAAGLYEAAYMRIRGIGSDGAMLELTGGLA
jgi:hypothetical protein